MASRLVAICFALVVSRGCQTVDPAGSQALTGQYDWSGMDGNRGPCCERDSAGIRVTLLGGGLDLGYNSGVGKYYWSWVQEYDYPDGTSKQTQFVFSTGTYTWDGKTLTLADSTGLGTMTGSAEGPYIVIQAQGHRHEFFRLPQTR